MVEYRRRFVDDFLDQWLAYLPAVSLEGPKAVGKTETALQRAGAIRRLDEREQRAIINASPELVLAGKPPILIDEWQRVPQTWDIVRRAVDENNTPGQFLLTGSASVTPGNIHSGAGRIDRVRMWPLTLPERGISEPTVSLRSLLGGKREQLTGATNVRLVDYAEQITRSGLPALQSSPLAVAERRVAGYVDRISEREVEVEGGLRVDVANVMRWLRAYAAGVATTASYEVLRDAATAGQAVKMAKTTDVRYRSVLEQLWIVEPLPAWAPNYNYLNRLAKSPKHIMADPAFAAAALGVTADSLVEGVEPLVARPESQHATIFGALFENLAIQHLRVFAQNNDAKVFHARTQGGREEIDAIVERRDGRFVAFEVKLGAVPGGGAFKHLKALRARAGDAMLDGVVLTSGSEAYRRDDGFAVVPLALLKP